jgi:hypothetical protein
MRSRWISSPWRNAVAVWLLTAWCAATPLRATTVPAYTPAQLQAAADVVVEGDVAVVESRWVGQRIITFVSVVVGTAPRLSTVVVAVLGGQVGDIAQRVPGSPRLDVGRRYRLYLGKADGPEFNGQRTRGVFGLFRGAFLVEGGQPVAFGDDGLPLRSLR